MTDQHPIRCAASRDAPQPAPLVALIRRVSGPAIPRSDIANEAPNQVRRHLACAASNPLPMTLHPGQAGLLEARGLAIKLDKDQLPRAAPRPAAPLAM
jgi:hypothetical protein